MGPMRRRLVSAVGASVAVALMCSLTLGGAIGAASPGAHAAKRKTITVNESADLHLDKKKGNILRESGTATGTLPGTVSARFDVTDISQVTGTVTFKPYSGGTITATVVAYPQSLGNVAKFSGGLSIKNGTGRYVRASGGGTLSGSVNRKTWHVVVSTKNLKLSYG